MKRYPHKTKDLTKKQRGEIQCLDYFGLATVDYGKTISFVGGKETSVLDGRGFRKINVLAGSDDAEACYFQITDFGEEEVRTNDIGRLKFLWDAQKWRSRMCDMYEEGVLEGSTPFYTLLVEDKPPLFVAKFMARRMFSGMKNEMIMRIYNDV